MGLLRTIIVILAFYYVFKIITRYVLPFFLKRFINKVQDNVRQQQGGGQQDPKVNVGETIIDKKPGESNQSNNSVGEYVDYEEVD
jgi:hypothetical protein